MKEESEEYFRQGLECFAKKSYSDAVWCFDEVLKCFPRDSDALFHKANAFFFKNENEQALACITQCITVYLENIEAWELKIKILSALGRPEEAEDCREVILDIQKRRREERENVPVIESSAAFWEKINNKLNREERLPTTLAAFVAEAQKKRTNSSRKKF